MSTSLPFATALNTLTAADPAAASDAAASDVPAAGFSPLGLFLASGPAAVSAAPAAPVASFIPPARVLSASLGLSHVTGKAPAGSPGAVSATASTLVINVVESFSDLSYLDRLSKQSKADVSYCRQVAEIFIDPADRAILFKRKGHVYDAAAAVKAVKDA